MNIEELEKTKRELKELKKENDKKIDLSDERTRMAKVNSFENKVFNVLGFSMLGYLPIFLSTSALINNMGTIVFTNVISALSCPAVVVGGSLGIGSLISTLISRKYKTKERYKSFSTAKTNAEKLEEEIYYQIELQKANNRNKAIDETLKVLDSNQVMLNRMSERYNMNDKTKSKTKEEAETRVGEISKIIEEQYDKLDTLTTQKVLHDNFWRIRSKLQKATDIVISSMLAGMFAMFFTGFPLMMIRDAVVYSSSFASMATLFGPFLAGIVGTTGYMIKRNSDHKKVFDTFNFELGENSLEENYKRFEGAYEEEQELSLAIEKQIRDISLAEVQLQENKRNLDSFITEEDSKSDILFKEYPNLRITEATRKIVLEHPELHSGLDVRTRMGKFYTDEEYEQRRNEVLSRPLPVKEEKGPRLVRRKKTSN